MDFAAARRAMVDSQLRPQAVTDPLVVSAMATVAREEFVPPESQAIAYIDRTLPIAPGRGLSPAASLGRILTELGPRPGERALVVGAGSGYSAAILSEIGCEVVAVECEPALAAELRTLTGVRTIEGPLETGAPDEAPFDLIIIDGQIEALPDHLVEQLKVGGRLGVCLHEGGVARLMGGTRSVHGFGLKSFADAPMAPLPGFARPRVFTF